jgi:hypothetical protein
LLRRVLVLLAMLLPLTLVSATPAAASATESEFVSRTNSARSSAGLRGYVVKSDLTAVARRQAARMASARRIYHNANLGSEVGSWRALGENVGRGGSVSRIHTAFMNASGHRANILSTSYTEVGIGTARGGDGLIYVSEVFRRPTYATSYAPAPARRTTTTAPARRTATRTTTTRRASRGAVRRPLPPARPVVVAKRPPAVVVNPVTGRLRSAWLLYRQERPVGSLDRVVTYVRTSQLLGR